MSVMKITPAFPAEVCDHIIDYFWDNPHVLANSLATFGAFISKLPNLSTIHLINISIFPYTDSFTVLNQPEVSNQLEEWLTDIQIMGSMHMIRAVMSKYLFNTFYWETHTLYVQLNDPQDNKLLQLMCQHTGMDLKTWLGSKGNIDSRSNSCWRNQVGEGCYN